MNYEEWKRLLAGEPTPEGGIPERRGRRCQELMDEYWNVAYGLTPMGEMNENLKKICVLVMSGRLK